MTYPEARPDAAFIGLMIFTALLFFRPQDQIRGLHALHLAELSAIGALIAMVAGRTGRGMTVSRVTPELCGVVRMGAIILFMAPFSVWPGGSIGTFMEVYSKIILIFILIVNTLTSRRRVEQFVWLIVIASGTSRSARSSTAYAESTWSSMDASRAPCGGMFKNPNDLALNMVAVIPLAASLALRSVTVIRRSARLCAYC